MTIEEAAAAMGVSGSYIRKLISEGRISAKKHGWAWLVSKSSVDRFIAKRAAKKAK